MITSKDVLNCMFNADEEVHLRVLADRKDDNFQAAKDITVKCGQFASVENELKEQNEKNRGICFVVNYGGSKDAQITRINAQFVEMDTGSIEEQRSKINDFPLPPSMIIQTRKSLHTYWFVENAEVARFRDIQKGLVKHFDGDPTCINESRVMRLPGYYHCKQEPVLVKCIYFHPEHKYTQDQLTKHLPQVESATSIKVREGTEKGLNIVMDKCDFIRYCKENAETLSEPDWYAMITNLAVFDGGVKMIHTLSAGYPGYNEVATAKKIKHFQDSGTRPMNCKTIAQKGFSCPRMTSGECDCKSPASLCFYPLSIEELRAIISELKITNSLSEDLQTASVFIRHYLFNQSEETAYAMIQDELKKHFKFGTDALKPLHTVYKSEHKPYQERLQAEKKTISENLPFWYVPTKTGLRFLPGILAEVLANSESVFFAAGQYFIYKNGVYQEFPELNAKAICQEKMLSSEAKMNQINDAENQWQLHVLKNVKDLNANPYIINVQNGLYNVLENTLSRHTPEYYSTIQLPVSYIPGADCPLFKQFLIDSMEGDMEQVALLQEMLGYFLIPVNSAQKCFVIVGAAAAGKSILLRVLQDLLLGTENVSNIAWQNLNDRFKTAELYGKLGNIFADLPTKNIDDNGIFKALVGEDYLTAEKKNKDPFAFKSTARLLFSCNSIPKNYSDRSEGFYRRLIFIRFKHSVPKEKRDPKLLEKFRGEANGIFMFALEGLQRLLDNEFVFSETSVNEQELQQYREDSDSVLSFMKECCKFDSGKAVGSTELYKRYEGYCTENGLKAVALGTLISRLKTENPNLTSGKDSTGNRRVVKGLTLQEYVL